MESLDAAALRSLFPEAFWQPFLDQGSRPDGRPAGQPRPADIGLGAVAHAASSALVKLGNTAVLAATRLEIMKPARESPQHGCIEVSFEMPPVCSPNMTAGRVSEEAQAITLQLKRLLTSAPCMDLKELCIIPKASAWAVFLDLVCIEADGSVFDAALLASVAALSTGDVGLDPLGAADSTSLGRGCPEDGAEEDDPDGDVMGQVQKDRTKKPFCVGRRHPRVFKRLPISQTLCIHKGVVLVDPTGEEERLWGGNNTIILVMDAADLGKGSCGHLLGAFKAGGQTPSALVTVHDCIASTKLSLHEKRKTLQEVFQ